MDGNEVGLWQLVTSRAGRDRGQAYLVARIDRDGFVGLVDGMKKRIESPKRKNTRHLATHPAFASELAVKARAGQTVKNSEVRMALSRLADGCEPGAGAGVGPDQGEVLPGSAKEWRN